MASAPANSLPIFYNDLIPLSTVDHADYRTQRSMLLRSW